MADQNTIKTVVKFDDTFYLKHQSGQYLVAVDRGRRNWPQLGNTGKVELQLIGGKGEVTSTGYIKIRTTEQVEANNDVLGAFGDSHDCYYWKDGYDDAKQGWRITKADGTAGSIGYGESVRISNISYANQRLAADTRYQGYITTVENAGDLWILESAVVVKPPDKPPTPEQLSSQPVLLFDGKDDYINCGKGGVFKALNLSETMTLECWVNLAVYKGGFIFAKQNDEKSDKPPIFYGLFIDDQKKTPMFVYSTTEKKNNQSVWEVGNKNLAEIALDRWYHLAVVVSNQQVELFVNGKSQGANKLEGKIADNADAELLIGKRYPNDSLLAGKLADLRVWKKARTAAEIQANFSQRLAYNEPDLVAYWPLNKGSGTVAYDTTRSDSYGIIYGGATWGISELPIAPLTPKEQFPYASKIGDISRFDPDKVLPGEVQPTDRWLANFHQLFKGLAVATFTLPENNKSPVPFMPANLTRLRPDKFSDEFFVERRLNGFNPGQLKRVENQPWQYVIAYDFTKVEVESLGIFPKTIEARFCLDGQQLHPHSIEYTLHGETKTQTPRPVDRDWEEAKKLFRCTDFVYHESRSHLGRTHFNIDQYAIAYYRNVVNNPIKQLLEPHFENTININQRGATEILGYTDKNGKDTDGLIPGNSPLNLNNITLVIKEELSNLTYRNWSPRQQTLPNYVVNNHFDPAANAIWGIINEYVSRFFANHQAGIKEHWAEIEGMSADLSSHSILKPELGTLDIKTMKDLEDLCVYVIYISSFFHSWVNNKQYEDGGDVDYVSIGLWQPVDPKKNPDEFIKGKIRDGKQVTATWSLSHVRYNLIMDVGPAELKDALWKQRHLIEPGLPLDRLLMSISI